VYPDAPRMPIFFFVLITSFLQAQP
jgi:hypothetical protein